MNRILCRWPSSSCNWVLHRYEGPDPPVCGRGLPRELPLAPFSESPLWNRCWRNTPHFPLQGDGWGAEWSSLVASRRLAGYAQVCEPRQPCSEVICCLSWEEVLPDSCSEAILLQFPFYSSLFPPQREAVSPKKSV